jgi:hypothetical protein
MNHPFALNLSDLEAVDLEFEEQLKFEDVAQVDGGILPGGCVLTQAFYETGYYPRTCPPIPTPNCPPITPPICPPTATTLALGEEGGYCY